MAAFARFLGRGRNASRLSGASHLPTPHQMADEQHFLQQLAEGETAAWEELLVRWSPPLYNYLIYSTHNELDAQHLLQETFSTFANYVMNGICIPQSVTELTIMVGSLVYQQSDKYQKQHGAPSLDVVRGQGSSEPISSEPIPSEPIQREFLRALRQLTLPIRQLLLLYHCIGLTVGELAAITGYNVATITLIFRALLLHFSYHKR